MRTEDIIQVPVTFNLPREAFVQFAPPPATVTQHSVEQHFGIPVANFKRMAREGLFPTKRVGRLIFAKYGDVLAAVTEGAEAQRHFTGVVEQVEGAPLQDDPPRTFDEAVAFIDGARTPSEQRERKRQVLEQGWRLENAYCRILDDGSPNPKHDKKLYTAGIDLVLAAQDFRRASARGRPGSKTTRRREVP